MFNKRYWRVQSEVSECGLACLSICSSILGAELDMSTLRRKYHNSQRGVDLNQLIALASALDMQCRPIRCEPEDLQGLSLPAILQMMGFTSDSVAACALSACVMGRFL